MPVIDAGIDDRDLDSGSCTLPAAQGNPCSRSVHQFSGAIQKQAEPALPHHAGDSGHAPDGIEILSMEIISPPRRRV
jgi:hypothetical protein